MHTSKTISFYYCLCAVLGLTCVVMWTDLVGQQSAFVEVANASQGIPNARLLCLVGQIAAALLCAACPRALRHWDRVLIAVIVGIYVLIALGFGLAVDGSRLHLATALACLLLAGAGYTAIAILLLSQIARLASPSWALGIIVAALASETCLFPFASSIPADKYLFVCLIGVPFLAAVCAIALPLLASRMSQVRDIAELPKCDKEARQRLFVLLATIAILRASVRALGSMGFWGTGNTGSNTPIDCLISAVLLILLTWPTMALYRNNDPFNRFLPAFLVVLGGFFLIDPTFVISHMISGQLAFLRLFVESFTYAMYWYVIVVSIRQLDVHPYRIAGLAFLLFSGFSAPLVLALSHSDALAGPLVMLVQYGFIVVMGITSLSAGQRPFSNSPVSQEENRLGLLADRHHLSPRECEVFLLLAQGRSRAYIEKELFIAEGTVKTHTSRIYQKFGVNSKQELISLVRDEVSSMHEEHTSS